MKFDWTFNLGHILIMLGMIFSGASIYIGIATKMTGYEFRLSVLERSSVGQETQNSQIMQQLGQVQRDVAVVKDRLERATK